MLILANCKSLFLIEQAAVWLLTKRLDLEITYRMSRASTAFGRLQELWKIGMFLYVSIVRYTYKATVLLPYCMELKPGQSVKLM